MTVERLATDADLDGVLAIEDAAKQANWGPYAEWYLTAQQGPIAVRKIYEEIEGKLK